MSTHNMFSCRNKISVVFGQKKKKKCLIWNYDDAEICCRMCEPKKSLRHALFFFSVANLTLSHKTFRRRLLSTI